MHHDVTAGVRRMLEQYVPATGLERNVSLHQLRRYLLTWPR
jgi:hypothetical protein